MGVMVELLWYEQEQAIIVGARRECEAVRKGLRNTLEATSTGVPFWEEEETHSLWSHIESAGAEKAVAKDLNLYWHASINTYRNGPADVGQSIEVRWRRHDDDPRKTDLIVRTDDQDDRIYVLVWGKMPRYEIMGWKRGSDAKRPEFLLNPGGHGLAWFVPPRYLQPVEELKLRSLDL